MKYGWNIGDIEARLQRSKKMKTREENTKTYIYQRMIRDYNSANHLGKVFIDDESFFKALDNFDLSYFDSPFFKTISYVAPQVRKLNFNNPCVFQCSSNGEDIIKISRDFYKKADKDNFTFFKQFTSVPSRIQFIDDNNSNPFNGRSYIISNNEFYVLVNHRNYLQDILSFTHESKHIENVLKGYNEGIALYQELPSILYSHYLLDYLEVSGEDLNEAESIRKSMLGKYCDMIVRMSDQMDYIRKLKSDSNFYTNVKQNFELYSEQDNLYDIYVIMQKGFRDKDIGNVVSFLVSIFIYLNSNIDNANNAVSLYMFGMHKMKPSMIDEVITYIKEISEDQKGNESFFQKIKKNS